MKHCFSITLVFLLAACGVRLEDGTTLALGERRAVRLMCPSQTLDGWVENTTRGIVFTDMDGARLANIRLALGLSNRWRNHGAEMPLPADVASSLSTLIACCGSRDQPSSFLSASNLIEDRL